MYFNKYSFRYNFHRKSSNKNLNKNNSTVLGTVVPNIALWPKNSGELVNIYTFKACFIKSTKKV